jgi:hypothetical protein
MTKIPIEYYPARIGLTGSDWCICPKPEDSEYPPGVIRARRTPEQRAADQAAGLEYDSQSDWKQLKIPAIGPDVTH